jgi:hypothetical protein
VPDCRLLLTPSRPFQFGDDFHFDIVSYMLHMHVKSNWQNGIIQMVPPVEVTKISSLYGRIFFNKFFSNKIKI